MLTPVDVKSLNDRFNHQPTEEILRWAWERSGSRAAIGTSFQGAGLVMIHLARQHCLSFPVLTLDTGLLVPHTLEFKNRLEDCFGSSIESLDPLKTVQEEADINGGDLWERNPVL